LGNAVAALSKKIMGFIVRPSFIGRRSDQAGGTARLFGILAGASLRSPGDTRERSRLRGGRQRTVQKPLHDVLEAALDPKDDIHAATPNHRLGGEIGGVLKNGLTPTVYYI
jgi:hypothetical protein